MQLCSPPIDNKSLEVFIPETMNGYGYFIDPETMKYIDTSSQYNYIDGHDNETYCKNTTRHSAHKDNTRIYTYTIVAIASFSATVFLFEYLHK